MADFVVVLEFDEAEDMAVLVEATDTDDAQDKAWAWSDREDVGVKSTWAMTADEAAEAHAMADLQRIV
jgi:hypothetical protein